MNFIVVDQKKRFRRTVLIYIVLCPSVSQSVRLDRAEDSGSVENMTLSSSGRLDFDISTF